MICSPVHFYFYIKISLSSYLFPILQHCNTYSSSLKLIAVFFSNNWNFNSSSIKTLNKYNTGISASLRKQQKKHLRYSEKAWNLFICLHWAISANKLSKYDSG